MKDWSEVQKDCIEILSQYGSLTVTQLTNKVNELPKNICNRINPKNLGWQLVYWTDKTETCFKRTHHGRYFVKKS